MGILKKVGRLAKKAVKAVLPGTGRHAAQRAANQANAAANDAVAKREALETKTKKERQRAAKLAIRGIRSKRAGSYFRGAEGNPSYGTISETIG